MTLFKIYHRECGDNMIYEDKFFHLIIIYLKYLSDHELNYRYIMESFLKLKENKAAK